MPADSLVPVNYLKVSDGEKKSFTAKAMEESLVEELRVKNLG